LASGTSFRGATMRDTRAYDATTGTSAGPKIEPGGIVVDAAFSPDGALVAIAALTAHSPDERNQRIFAPDGKAATFNYGIGKTDSDLSARFPCQRSPAGLRSHTTAEV
jgi:hypothetical protein